METYVITVTNVHVFEGETSKDNNVQITFTTDKKPVMGFVRDGESYVEREVNTISFPRAALTAMLCDLNDDIALYRSMIDHAFGQREFGGILFKSTLTINREIHSAGEIVGEGENSRTLERDCWFTDLAKVELAKRAQKLLDDAISL